MSFVDGMLEAYSAPVLNQGFGVSVTLQHGGETTNPFTATWESKVYQVADNEGFITVTESRDFTFAVGDASINGTAFEPRAGDRISISENSIDTQYELLPIGQLPAFELMPGNYRYKVHTKRVR